MKNLFLFLALVCVLSSIIGCGGSSDSGINNDLVLEGQILSVTSAGFPVKAVDSDLMPFLDEFIDEMRTRGINFDLSNFEMVYASTPDGVAGICYVGEDLVEISTLFITRRANLRELVYHELGHCVLGMDHRDNSIMQASGFVGISQALLDELFSPEFYFELNSNSSAHSGELEIKYF